MDVKHGFARRLCFPRLSFSLFIDTNPPEGTLAEKIVINYVRLYKIEICYD